MCNFFSPALSATEKISKPDDSFLQNKGQWQKEILFKGSSASTNVYFLKDGLSFAEVGEEVENPDGSEDYPFLVWNMKFVNPNPAMEISGVGGKKSVVSYLSGSDPGKWIVHPEEYSQLQYTSIYKNIDLHFYGSGNNLKYDYIVHHGGDIKSIRAYYEGIKNLSVNADGELEVETEWNTQLQKTPLAWQLINGVKQFVNVNYKIINDTTFGFEAINGFNKNYDLIIDPLFEMVWSSYTNIPGGSNNINYCFANAMDNDGNVYLTGYSDDSFPITPGAYSGASGIGPEVYIAKFSSDGTTLIYWTYLLGESSEFGADIAVDEFGRAYVTGVVEVNITGLTSFATTANAYQTAHNAGGDAFLTVLNPAGSGLVYSTFIGGTGGETAYSVALGGNGIAYIAGETSTGNFPVKASPSFPTGSADVFVAKFDINQIGNNSLIYSARIGGGVFSYCGARSVAVDNSGNAFVTGTLGSSFGTPAYPTTTGAYSTVYNPGLDGGMFFVTKLSNTIPVTLSYSTFIAPGTSSAIDVDPITGDAFVSGTTYTFAFPVTAGALQPVHAGAGGTDAFAVRLNAAGNALVYCTFLGGIDYDKGTGIAVNSAGEAYISGISQNSFPTSPGAYQPNNAGTYDFFVVNLNATGTGYACGGSTYVGGSDADYSGSFYDYPAPKVSIRNHGGNNDTICVSATSHSQDFPTTPGVYGPVKVNGIADQPVFFKMTCFTAGAIPAINLSSTDTTWCDKKAIDFFDLSANNPTSWQWYFPGATPDTSSAQNPQGIYYPSYGSYNVTLVACNAFGCDSITFTNFIIEYQIPAPPVITISNDTLFSSPAFSYQWYDLTGAIAGATNDYYVITQPGTYFVLISDSIGCNAASNTIVVTAINDFINNHNGIIVYPNPFSTTTTLSFHLEKTGNVTVTIYDVTGRKIKNVFTGKLSSGIQEIKIDSKDLGKGIYFCEVKTISKSFKTKTIIQ
ncbi:MAG: T9SS type A sorting domain-containing protein [Bacteroidia bacterium]